MDLLSVLLAPLLLILLLAVPAGAIRYFRYANLPRYPSPVFPHHAAEAERALRHWQRHNRHQTLYADVRLEDGRVVRDVGFDPDSLVAVEIDGGPVSVWYYRQPIAGSLVLGEGLSQTERERYWDTWDAPE